MSSFFSSFYVRPSEPHAAPERGINQMFLTREDKAENPETNVRGTDGTYIYEKRTTGERGRKKKMDRTLSQQVPSLFLNGGTR